METWRAGKILGTFDCFRVNQLRMDSFVYFWASEALDKMHIVHQARNLICCRIVSEILAV